jgi:diketogulonate reductase-like aldo/keto reductase
MEIEKNEKIKAIAEKMNISAMQVILAWTRHHGVVTVPRSRNPEHIAENLKSLDIELSPEDIATLDSMDENWPYYWLPEAPAQTIPSADVSK